MKAGTLRVPCWLNCTTYFPLPRPEHPHTTHREMDILTDSTSHCWTCWNSDSDRWQYIDKVVFSYNTSQHETTEGTPHFLVFGQEAQMLIKLVPLPAQADTCSTHTAYTNIFMLTKVQNYEPQNSCLHAELVQFWPLFLAVLWRTKLACFSRKHNEGDKTGIYTCLNMTTMISSLKNSEGHNKNAKNITGQFCSRNFWNQATNIVLVAAALLVASFVVVVVVVYSTNFATAPALSFSIQFLPSWVPNNLSQVDRLIHTCPCSFSINVTLLPSWFAAFSPLPLISFFLHLICLPPVYSFCLHSFLRILLLPLPLFPWFLPVPGLILTKGVLGYYWLFSLLIFSLYGLQMLNFSLTAVFETLKLVIPGWWDFPQFHLTFSSSQ